MNERTAESELFVFEDAIREDACIVCKRHEADAPHGLCHGCFERLHGTSPRATL